MYNKTPHFKIESICNIKVCYGPVVGVVILVSKRKFFIEEKQISRFSHMPQDYEMIDDFVIYFLHQETNKQKTEQIFCTKIFCTKQYHLNTSLLGSILPITFANFSRFPCVFIKPRVKSLVQLDSGDLLNLIC